MLAAFEDGTLHIWASDTFDLIWRIDLSTLKANPTRTSDSLLPALTSFTMSTHGQLLAASTNDGNILVWDVKSKQLQSEISIPSLKGHGIQKIRFIRHRDDLVVLTTHGTLFIFNTKQNKLICRPKMKHPVLLYPFS